MLGTGEFTYLPNYTDVATGAAERFSVRVTQQTPFVNALQQLPLIGLVVSQLLTSVREIPVLNGLLAPIIGSSVVVPVDVDLAHLVPAGDTVAYTYKLTSFDGTPISVNFFPALGLHTGDTAPSVVYGPGMTRPGDTDPYGQGFVGIGTMRSAGYNVITWDPRGEYDSGGLLQLDNPNLEGKDVSYDFDDLDDTCRRRVRQFVDGPAGDRRRPDKRGCGGSVDRRPAARHQLPHLTATAGALGAIRTRAHASGGRCSIP